MPLTPQVDLGLEERQQRCKACRNCIVSIHGIAQRIQPAAKLLAKLLPVFKFPHLNLAAKCVPSPQKVCSTPFPFAKWGCNSKSGVFHGANPTLNWALVWEFEHWLLQPCIVVEPPQALGPQVRHYWCHPQCAAG